MSDNLVPIIAKEQFDDVATAFLERFCPEALLSPVVVPIEDIARDKMNLIVERVRITEDLSLYGQIFFTDGQAEVYKEDTDEYIRRKVKKGTVFIDSNVFSERNLGCERNTIAHECLHWYKHKAYHTLQSIVNDEMAVACKCPIQENSKIKTSQWNDVDWMEWQANGIAPKILMPKEMFRIKVEEFSGKNTIFKEFGNNEIIYGEWVVRKIADFFKVSMTSAKIRLSELGYRLEN